jgi:hypothetical protein
MRTWPEDEVSTTKEHVSGQSWEQAVMIGIGTSKSVKFCKTYQKQNRKTIVRMGLISKRLFGAMRVCHSRPCLRVCVLEFYPSGVYSLPGRIGIGAARYLSDPSRTSRRAGPHRALRRIEITRASRAPERSSPRAADGSSSLRSTLGASTLLSNGSSSCLDV